MSLGIRKADYIADYKVKLEFNNGETWTVDLENELNGTVFIPLRDKSYFSHFSLVFDTIEWENGANFDPEYLYEIGKIQHHTVKEQAIAYINTQPIKEHMSTEELKLQIHRQIDALDAPNVKELYGLMVNYINSKKESSEWLGVSEFEQQGIEEAINEMNAGKGISHEQVMSKLKSRHKDA